LGLQSRLARRWARRRSRGEPGRCGCPSRHRTPSALDLRDPSPCARAASRTRLVPLPPSHFFRPREGRLTARHTVASLSPSLRRRRTGTRPSEIECLKASPRGPPRVASSSLRLASEPLAGGLSRLLGAALVESLAVALDRRASDPEAPSVEPTARGHCAKEAATSRRENAHKSAIAIAHEKGQVARKRPRHALRVGDT
jgi:hypothetical protein